MRKTKQNKTKLARVARKRGHKRQFGWNKNKKVSQLMLQNNYHFPSLPNLFSSPLSQLAPVFFRVVAILEKGVFHLWLKEIFVKSLGVLVIFFLAITRTN